MSDLDLTAYFRRIGHDGPATATPDVLRKLHELHPRAIAFENLDPFLHRPVPLELPALQQKLVHERRGGYCFEQNLLFMQVLRTLGFRVSGLAARVLWNQAEDAITPRSHMLIRVELEGRTWLADVGFGGLTLTAPLLLEPDLEQKTPHERFRIVASDGHYRMQAEVGGEWRTLYRFDLSEQFEIDYAVTNYFLFTHPNSHFRSRLIAARPTPEGRLALLNNRLTTHRLGGPSETRRLETAGEIASVLEELFEINIPDAAALEAAVARERLLEAE